MFANLSTQSQTNVFVRFLLDADSSPGLLSRLLQPYAKRDLIPDRMWSHRSGKTIHVEIAMEAMPAEMVHLVEGNLRQVVGVRNVTRISGRACKDFAKFIRSHGNVGQHDETDRMGHLSSHSYLDPNPPR